MRGENENGSQVPPWEGKGPTGPGIGGGFEQRPTQSACATAVARLPPFPRGDFRSSPFHFAASRPMNMIRGRPRSSFEDEHEDVVIGVEDNLRVGPSEI